jgi:hypothetical protein
LAGSPKGKSAISGIGRRRKDYIKTDILHGFSRCKLFCVSSRYSPVAKLGEHGNKGFLELSNYDHCEECHEIIEHFPCFTLRIAINLLQLRDTEMTRPDGVWAMSKQSEVKNIDITP